MGDENEENLIEKVRNLAARAVQHDQLKQLSAAVYFYHEAAKVMDQLYSLTGKDSYQAHGEKYKKRAGTLYCFYSTLKSFQLKTYYYSNLFIIQNAQWTEKVL